VLEPLRSAEKLGAVHLQFAPWITAGGDARKHVEHCADRMKEWLTSVESRNVELLDRPPIGIIHLTFVILTFDSEGRFDTDAFQQQ